MTESRGESANRLDSILARGVNLPVQGPLLPRLQQFLGNPDSNTDEILGMIKLDPGLTGRILQRANSVVHARGNRIGSMDEAVARIGYREVSRLLMESVARRLLARPLHCYGLAPGALWRASLAGAFAMEELASHTHRSEDTAYTSGLLHAVGMVLVSQEIESEGPERLVLGNPFEPGLDERERRRFGCDHAEVGAALLELWGFPDAMTEAVRYQLSPTRSPNVPRLACLLGLALWIRNRQCAGTGTAAREGPDPYLVKLADLDEDGLSRIVGSVGRRLSEAEMLTIG
ncbi:MAG: HDOD domain-containing protein [Opitutaceae bacterium]